MDLSLREVARLLGVSENTVSQWARAGAIPATRHDQQYMFNRVSLQEWAVATGRKVSPELFAPHGAVTELPSLREAILRGGIFYALGGTTREEVLREVSQLPGIPGNINRERLNQLLCRREALASTGIGDGIALPHPRDPLVVEVDEPLVLLCFLKQPVEFFAVDGHPVRVLFSVLAPSVRVHLQMLSLVAYALHDAKFSALLKTPADKDALLARLAELETEQHRAKSPHRPGGQVGGNG